MPRVGNNEELIDLLRTAAADKTSSGASAMGGMGSPPPAPRTPGSPAMRSAAATPTTTRSTLSTAGAYRGFALELRIGSGMTVPRQRCRGAHHRPLHSRHRRRTSSRTLSHCRNSGRYAVSASTQHRALGASVLMSLQDKESIAIYERHLASN